MYEKHDGMFLRTENQTSTEPKRSSKMASEENQVADSFKYDEDGKHRRYRPLFCCGRRRVCDRQGVCREKPGRRLTFSGSTQCRQSHTQSQQPPHQWRNLDCC